MNKPRLSHLTNCIGAKVSFPIFLLFPTRVMLQCSLAKVGTASLTTWATGQYPVQVMLISEYLFSDLDGDQYFVLMRKLLIPSEEACNAHPPPLRTPAPPSGVASIAISYSSSSSSSSGQYTVSRSSRATDTKMQTDAVELFMALRCNFLIGRLSKAWLADVGNTRAMSDAWFCKELAPLIEQALVCLHSAPFSPF